jgi:deazaflavin-dependent oxidoreductase (nitroreductase family)
MPRAISNFFVKTVLNSPFYGLMGRNFAVISLKGRRSGKVISTPINVFPVEGVLTAVSLRSRTWWRNLRQGGPAFLRFGGKRVEVRAEVIERHDAVASGLESYLRQYPHYARYFQVQLDADRRPEAGQLQRLAEERVLIRLIPVS